MTILGLALSNLIALGFAVIGVLTLFLYRFRYRRLLPEIRTYPVFPTLADQVGRASEEGVSIHIALGSGSLTGDSAMTSIAALQSLDALLDLSAAYNTPPLMTTGDPTLFVLARDWMRRAYVRLGDTTLYPSTAVQFTAASPALYTAMTATHLFDGKVGTNVMIGAFNQEISMLMDAANRKGIYTVGGTTSMEGVSALYPILGPRELVMGEEIFAGGAIATRRPMYWASLWAHDVLRWFIVLGIVAAAVLSFLGITGGM